jgi:uncharacterized protein Yka (UPF0111/DUF47 family)
MSKQLDLDDVAATSELAKQELAALRAENQRMREALEKIVKLCEYYGEIGNQARAVITQGANK